MSKEFDAKIKQLPVKREKQRISVSQDYDIDPKDTYPVILYVPHVDFPDHEHICLTDEAAKELYDWLGEYLASKKEHVATYVKGAGLIDEYVCSCGWKSGPYYDGADYALEAWEKHAKKE